MAEFLPLLKWKRQRSGQRWTAVDVVKTQVNNGRETETTDEEWQTAKCTCASVLVCWLVAYWLTSKKKLQHGMYCCYTWVWNEFWFDLLAPDLSNYNRSTVLRSLDTGPYTAWPANEPWIQTAAGDVTAFLMGGRILPVHLDAPDAQYYLHPNTNTHRWRDAMQPSRRIGVGDVYWVTDSWRQSQWVWAQLPLGLCPGVLRTVEYDAQCLRTLSSTFEGSWWNLRVGLVPCRMRPVDHGLQSIGSTKFYVFFPERARLRSRCNRTTAATRFFSFLSNLIFTDFENQRQSNAVHSNVYKHAACNVMRHVSCPTSIPLATEL